MVNIEKIEVNISGSSHITNTFLVYNENNKGILIDPGDEAKKIITKIEDLNLDIKYIVITHGHADHIGALEEILNTIKVKVIIHENDYDSLIGIAENYSEMLEVKKQYLDNADIFKVTDGYILNVDEDFEFEIIHTPGHTAGCICLFEKTSNSLFTGDTIFHNCYGRCDLYGGDINKMANSLKKIFIRFDDVTIYPGHEGIVNISSAKKKIRMLMSLKGIVIGD